MNYPFLRTACLLVAVLLTFVGGLWPMQAVQAQTFLSSDQAFQVEVLPFAGREVQVSLTPARGIYLYREQMQATWRADGVVASGAEANAEVSLSLSTPPAESKYDPNFERVVEIYHHRVLAQVRLPEDVSAGVLTIGYQGCADAGICYPPLKRSFAVTVNAAGEVVSASPVDPALLTDVSRTPAQASWSERWDIGQALGSGHVGWVILAFFLAGLLLSLTPCVLPMVPILSSIIVGQRQAVSRGKGFALALSYSQGMALVYTALGVAAGLMGQGLTAYLQHPWVVLTFAALMLVLALSMWGVYELRMPSALQTRLGVLVQRLPGGQLISVFVMGLVSALIVSPCVSAPLAGALLYISQTHDVWLGGTALYAMAWGMSVPLLLVGVSASSVLPRSGPWMSAVKGLFGLIMVGMAVWVAQPAWPYVKTQWLGQPASGSAHQSVLPFQTIESVQDLDAALTQAQAQGQMVMLDFYADWCTTCIQMERQTFSDPQVQAALKGVRLLQVDVTLNTPEDRALLKRFELFGPPAMVWFDANGRDLPALRLIGFESPSEFLKRLRQAGL